MFLVQLCGSKVWNLRPNEDGRWPSGQVPFSHLRGKLRVEIKAGDMILINTRLWFHETEIPCSLEARDGLSLSYARDFHIAAQVYISIYIYIYVCCVLCVYMCVCMCMCVCIYLCICVYVNVYMSLLTLITLIVIS